MKLDIKYAKSEYKELSVWDKPQPELKPTLRFMKHHIIDNFNNGFYITTGLIDSLFNDYVSFNDNHSKLNRSTRERELIYGNIALASTSKVRIESPKQLLEYFDCPTLREDIEELQDEYDKCFFDDYEVFIYPYSRESKMYPTPTAREAMMSSIYVRGNIVSFDYCNVYKYYDWDELLPDVAGIKYCKASNTRTLDNTDKFSEEDTYMFTLITDNESLSGVTSIFNTTIAGVLTNYKTKTKIVFNKHQAIHIYYFLFILCQQFIDAWVEMQESQKTTVSIDTIDEPNPYVHEFFSRLELIESLDDLDFFMYNVSGECFNQRKYTAWDYGSDGKEVNLTEQEKIVGDYFVNKYCWYDRQHLEKISKEREAKTD